MNLAILFTAVSSVFSLPPGLLSAVCYVESHHQVKAVNKDDGKGSSLGVCQIKLPTAKMMGFKGTEAQLMTPDANIIYAAKYLSYQLTRYDADPRKAVAAYNTGTYTEFNGVPRKSKLCHKGVHGMAKQEIKPKLTFKIKINRDFWTVSLYTKKDFEKKWKRCVAITEYEHKTPDLAINFKGPKVSKDTICHEIVHAFLSYKDLSKLKPDTIEERFCELMGKKYKILAQLTDKVFLKLTDKAFSYDKGQNRESNYASAIRYYKLVKKS